jgi:hypothetical protein
LCSDFSFEEHFESSFNSSIESVLVQTAQWCGYSSRIAERSHFLYFSASTHDIIRPFRPSSLKLGKLLGGAITLYCIHSIAGERLYNQSGK